MLSAPYFYNKVTSIPHLNSYEKLFSHIQLFRLGFWTVTSFDQGPGLNSYYCSYVANTSKPLTFIIL